LLISTNVSLISFAEFPFGRDRFTLDELLPRVPAVFNQLRLKYHVCTSNEYREKLDTINDPAVLREMLDEWTWLSYSDEALGLIAMRMIDLANATGVPVITSVQTPLTYVSVLIRSSVLLTFGHSITFRTVM
jgi:hypothetical protein